jgi:E3 ubiquitin-protein ligase synoviolin
MPQVLSMKAEYLVLLSFLMTFAVVTNAFYTKKQFYPSVVYLTKSSTSLAVNSILPLILNVILVNEIF